MNPKNLGIIGLLFVASTACGGELPWLGAKGTGIVDSSGRTVQLRGVNLGGYLVEEMWMMPFQTKPPADSNLAPIRDHVTLWAAIEKRLGPAAAGEIRSAFRSNWLQESDFDRLKSLGVNCVRLPLLHSLLDEPNGLAWLDRPIRWAAQRGIYTILDLHGAPGCQSKDHHTGQADRNEFFKNPEMVAQGEKVWKALARRYRDRPEVAGYDLLNEPMGAPNTTTLYQVQDRLYRAIRQEDRRHIIIVEDGYTGAAKMPIPASFGWQNVVFSVHTYKFDSKSADDQLGHLASTVKQLQKEQKLRGVPYYIGEFNQEPHGNGQTMLAFFQAMRDNGWSWSLWTYKIAMRNGDRSMWGLYRLVQPMEAIDPFSDTKEQMISKSQKWRTEFLEIHDGLKSAFAGIAGGKTATQ